MSVLLYHCSATLLLLLQHNTQAGVYKRKMWVTLGCAHIIMTCTVHSCIVVVVHVVILYTVY